MVKVNKSSSFDFDKKWTKRKLRNVSIESIRTCVEEALKAKLTESQLNLISNTNKLIAAHLCNKYRYTKDDFNLIKEGTRIYTATLTLAQRKTIEQYEEANNIKTIWEDKIPSNVRNQHFKIPINE